MKKKKRNNKKFIPIKKTITEPPKYSEATYGIILNKADNKIHKVKF